MTGVEITTHQIHVDAGHVHQSTNQSKPVTNNNTRDDRRRAEWKTQIVCPEFPVQVNPITPPARMREKALSVPELLKKAISFMKVLEDP